MTILQMEKIVYFLGKIVNHLSLTYDDLLFYQRLLKAEGLYQDALDGIWGKYTDQAAIDFMAESISLEEELGRFDMRTENNIRSLSLAGQSEARQFMQRLSDFNLTVKIISGTRTYKQQDALYEQGRSKPGKKVTWAKAGRSYHNFGMAWDIAVFNSRGAYLTTGKSYERAAKVAMDTKSLFWGGNWTTLRDYPHYQLRTEFQLAQIRHRFEKGEKFFETSVIV